MDLDNFPTSVVGKRMLKNVSPIYDKSYVAKWLFQVMGMEIDSAWNYIQELRNQGFVELATWGLTYWEQQYGIRPNPSGTTKERRDQIIYSRTSKSPMNPAKFVFLLEKACGKEIKITENIAPYTFGITVYSIPEADNDEAIRGTLNTLKPAHLSFSIVHEQGSSSSLFFGGIINVGKIFTIRQVN